MNVQNTLKLRCPYCDYATPVVPETPGVAQRKAPLWYAHNNLRAHLMRKRHGFDHATASRLAFAMIPQEALQ